MKFLRRKKLKFLLPIIALFGIFLVANFVFAQIDPGLAEFGEATQLGSGDVRITIARIIRTGLGLLGIVAVVIVIAGGVYYMTAGGDTRKIDIAKKIMINGAIGLALILTSFAIAQFVLNSLIEATTSEEAGGGAGGPGGIPGGFGPTAFTLRGINPTGDIAIRNVTVRATFNSGVDGESVEGHFNVVRVSDDSPVEGTFTTARNTIEFTPAANCPPPNEDRKCFDADTEYRVTLTEDIQNLSGLSLVCGGFTPSCEAFFTTGNLVDVAGPSVVITAPGSGESIPQNSFVVLQADATDDAGISQIEFFIDSAFEDTDAPVGGTPLSYTGSVEWDTTGVVLGRHAVTARAYDIDDNNTLSREVNFYVRAEHCFNGIIDGDEINVDCGGTDCASCEGGPCEEDGDCASGLCREGICIEVPRIDAVSPLDGREENYITIAGSFFGNEEGQIIFLGEPGDSDNQVAPLASCDGAWQNNQVIVEVPVGAVDGPIQIIASTGESDRTDDERGILIPNFDVNSIARPGLCSLVPSSGVPTDAVQYIGTGFGDSQGGSSAFLDGRDILPSSWGNTSITGTVPNLSRGRKPAQVVVGGEVSNPVYFDVSSIEAGTIPSITYIDPSSGPRENIITIFGENFGRTVGTVIFTNETTGDNAIGSLDFPVACGDSLWSSDSIVVKVPVIYSSGLEVVDGVHSVKVQRADGVESTSVEFVVEDGVAGPGICRIDPNNGPVDTNVTIYGERFGVDRGTVNFWNEVSASISGWGDEQIMSLVPDTSETGPVTVSIGDQVSNRVNFRVSNCNEAGCGEGEQCCENGICISEDDSCSIGPRFGGFFWQFSTGIIPTVPRVVEECSEGASPSPSPWDKRRGGDSVCLNAAVNVRFTESIDPATLTSDTIQVYRCISEDLTNPCLEGDLVSGDIRLSDDGFSFTPIGAETFLASTKYYVNLTTGIRGAGAFGEYLVEDSENCGIGNAYCFSFGTRAEEELCEIGGVVVDPANTVIEEEGGTKTYRSSAISRDDICISLDSDSYNWNWRSSNPIQATITNNDVIGGEGDLSDGRVDPVQTATGFSETEPDVPVRITAGIASESVSDYGNLTVNFIDPKISAYWPSCTSACVNSDIGALFNTSMDTETIVRPGNFIVYECENESCRRFIREVSGAVRYSVEEKEVVFDHELLDETTYYRAIIRGGGDGVLSSSGVPLTQTNYGEDGLDYSWVFRTRNSSEPCAVSSVELKPKTTVLSYIGEIQEYNTVASGAPDECNARGQRLQATSYNWDWRSSEMSVADFVRFAGDPLNVLPRNINNGCSDKCLNTGTRGGVAVCGNGSVEKGEDCDDGNIFEDDGCSSICLNEGSELTEALCGDGIVGRGEDCDDRNTSSGDGCSSICLNEGSMLGESVCGNRDIGDGEDCDDGNSRDGDGCSQVCLNEGSLTGPIPVCGNRVVENGEDCDDGNLLTGDGCGATCLNEGNNKCVDAGDSNCCGNGSLENGEDCDDGNSRSGDGCSSMCLSEGSNVNNGSICGNGITSDDLELGEECEFAGTRDLNFDPLQYAEALSGGMTTISAGTEGIFDDGTLEVSCTCTGDASCSFGSTFPGELGCGIDGCCNKRATLVSYNPTGSGACRNSAVTAEFDQLIDAESFENNFRLLIARSGDCPEGTTILNASYCEVSGNITYKDILGKTTFTFIPEIPLNPNLRHIAIIYVDRNLTDDRQTGVKNRNGIPVLGRISGDNILNYSWSFTTGSDICALDEVEVNPSPLYFLQPNTQDIFVNAYARVEGLRQEIVPIPRYYDWDWNWSIRDLGLVNITGSETDTETVSVPLEDLRKGETSILATATIREDRFSRIPTVGRQLTDEGRIIVMLCQNPWPARNPDGSWSPYEEIGDGNNFRFYYCRDAGDESLLRDDLPSITTPVQVPNPPLDNILSEFLIPVNCPGDSPSCGRGDGMGIRVMMNQEHYSPQRWYNLSGFSGVPAEIAVDGYPAIQDGRTVYVNAANNPIELRTIILRCSWGGRCITRTELVQTDDLYTNIYIISYTEGAGVDTIDIFNQILENLSFTTTIDSETSKDEIRRDVRRLADVRSTEEALIRYGRVTKRCSVSQGTVCLADSDCPIGEGCVNSYPRIESGSFFDGYTNSSWSSWQDVLGTDLGIIAPVDPFNKFNITVDSISSAGECIGSYSATECLKAIGCLPPYNNETCYSSDTRTFSCPLNSFVYSYENCAGNNFNLGFSLEHRGLNWVMNKLFNLPYNLTMDYCTGEIFDGGTICSRERGEPGVIDTTVGCGNGVLEIDLGEVCDDGSLNGSYNRCDINCLGWGYYCGDHAVTTPEVCDLSAETSDGGVSLNNGDYNALCSWDCLSPRGPYCGDGEIQEEYEECELGQRETTKEAVDGLPACEINAGGYETQRTRVCRETTCSWGSWGACLPTGSCGNGRVDSDQEECDDGNTSNEDACTNECKLAYCGDGLIRADYEQCDLGSSVNGTECTPGVGLVCTYCSDRCTLLTISD